MAQSLFGTHLGTDLFNNESALRSSLNLKFKTALDTMLTTDNGVEKTSADDTYMKGALLQILNHLPERLADITTLQVGVDATSGETWYKIPFVAGDKIYFNLTVQPAVDQSSATTGATVNNRVYLVRGTLV